MSNSVADDIVLVIPTVAIVCVFTFVAVVVWADTRRKEREVFYRNELLKKLAETSGPAAESVLTLLREEDVRKRRRLREGMTLAGLICIAAGLCLAVLLLQMPDLRPGLAVAVAMLPFSIGLVLAGYARFVLGKA